MLDRKKSIYRGKEVREVIDHTWHGKTWFMKCGLQEV
jgi:hypothetical protein